MNRTLRNQLIALSHEEGLSERLRLEIRRELGDVLPGDKVTMEWEGRTYSGFATVRIERGEG